MSTPRSTEELTSQIEQVVRQYVAEGRRAAHEALERAFAATSKTSSRQPSKPKARASEESAGRRRSSWEVAQLGERLCELVRAYPGESMTMFAAELGMSVRELHRPMSVLRRKGRVRSVGQRRMMRYFPGVAGKASEQTTAA